MYSKKTVWEGYSNFESVPVIVSYWIIALGAPLDPISKGEMSSGGLADACMSSYSIPQFCPPSQDLLLCKGEREKQHVAGPLDRCTLVLAAPVQGAQEKPLPKPAENSPMLQKAVLTVSHHSWSVDFEVTGLLNLTL